jgi:transcriptional regulator with XRE-family HTH domain
MDFALLIKETRRKLGLSQEELADALFVSFSTINRWENGHVFPNKLARKRFVDFCKSKGIEIDEGIIDVDESAINEEKQQDFLDALLKSLPVEEFRISGAKISVKINFSFSSAEKLFESRKAGHDYRDAFALSIYGMLDEAQCESVNEKAFLDVSDKQLINMMEIILDEYESLSGYYNLLPDTDDRFERFYFAIKKQRDKIRERMNKSMKQITAGLPYSMPKMDKSLRNVLGFLNSPEMMSNIRQAQGVLKPFASTGLPKAIGIDVGEINKSFLSGLKAPAGISQIGLGALAGVAATVPIDLGALLGITAIVPKDSGVLTGVSAAIPKWLKGIDVANLHIPSNIGALAPVLNEAFTMNVGGINKIADVISKEQIKWLRKAAMDFDMSQIEVHDDGSILFGEDIYSPESIKDELAIEVEFIRTPGAFQNKIKQFYEKHWLVILIIRLAITLYILVPDILTATNEYSYFIEQIINDEHVCYVVNEAAKVRSNPDSNSDIVIMVRLEERLVITDDTKKHWFKVTYRDPECKEYEGWISKRTVEEEWE